MKGIKRNLFLPAVLLVYFSCSKSSDSQKQNAVINLSVSTGVCTAPFIQGNYITGTALNSTNKLSFPVTVTAAGDYSLYTNTVNGCSFKASGTFTSTGQQTVTLTGTGTPLNTGTISFSISGASESCNFLLSFF